MIKRLVFDIYEEQKPVKGARKCAECDGPIDGYLRVYEQNRKSWNKGVPLCFSCFATSVDRIWSPLVRSIALSSEPSNNAGPSR
jgi:hypothetical protein